MNNEVTNKNVTSSITTVITISVEGVNIEEEPG